MKVLLFRLKNLLRNQSKKPFLKRRRMISGLMLRV